MSMKPEIKKLWVDALRSDSYQQGNGALRTGDRYCCLGVLCDLAVKAGLNLRVTESASVYEGDLPFWSYDGESGTLPDSVGTWAGLDSRNPVVPEPDDFTCPCGIKHEENGTETLAGLNDGGYTFDQIADVVDAQL